MKKGKRKYMSPLTPMVDKSVTKEDYRNYLKDQDKKMNGTKKKSGWSGLASRSK